MPPAKFLVFALLAGLGAAIATAQPAAFGEGQAATLGIIFVIIGLWSTAILPNYMASLVLFCALLIPGLAEPSTVFAGFTSTAMWLIVAGFVIGAAIRTTGLGQRIGAAVAPHLSKSYTALIAGLVILGALLGFLMPSSMGRATVLMPLGLALADALGLAPGSKGRTGVAVTTAMAATMPSFAILPANVPNMVLIGASENILGIHISYTDYLALHYPILGLGKAALMTWLLLRLFPVDQEIAAQNSAEPAPPSPAQTRLLVMLLAVLALWATDRIHGVSPAWIGLAAATLLLMPRVGFVRPDEFRQAVDFPTLLFIGGVLAMGTVVSASGLGETLAPLVIGALPLSPGADFLNFMSLSVFAAASGFLTTMA
ncbi:MAG: SLC13 family permease, partial [Mangrovicoccus sp.]